MGACHGRRSPPAPGSGGASGPPCAKGPAAGRTWLDVQGVYECPPAPFAKERKRSGSVRCTARRRRRSARGQRARQPPLPGEGSRGRTVRAGAAQLPHLGLPRRARSHLQLRLRRERGTRVPRSERDDAPAGLHPRAGVDHAGVGRARAAGDARVVLLARPAQRRLHDGADQARAAPGTGDVHRSLARERPRGGLAARRLSRSRAPAGGAVDRPGAPHARDDGRGPVDDRRSSRHRGCAGAVGQPGKPQHVGSCCAGRPHGRRAAVERGNGHGFRLRDRSALVLHGVRGCPLVPRSGAARSTPARGRHASSQPSQGREGEVQVGRRRPRNVHLAKPRTGAQRERSRSRRAARRQHQRRAVPRAARQRDAAKLGEQLRIAAAGAVRERLDRKLQGPHGRPGGVSQRRRDVAARGGPDADRGWRRAAWCWRWASSRCTCSARH